MGGAWYYNIQAGHAIVLQKSFLQSTDSPVNIVSSTHLHLTPWGLTPLLGQLAVTPVQREAKPHGPVAGLCGQGVHSSSKPSLLNTAKPDHACSRCSLLKPAADITIT